MSYWDEGDLILENYATGARLAAQPVTTEILGLFRDWRTPEAVLPALPRFSARSIRRAIEALSRHTLLERSDRPEDPAARALSAWASWNPHAGLFHMTTKRARYVSNELVRRNLLAMAAREPPPSAVKRYPKRQQVELPAPRIDGELSAVLLARRTWRRFGRGGIDITALGTLLGLTWGIQSWVDQGAMGRTPLKTSPSGGGRHPIEAYVLARRVEGLSPGLYHYEAEHHRLESVSKGIKQRQIESYLPAQWWYGRASVVVFMTAVFERTQWKYRVARAYRVVVLEAGHFCQTFLLVATRLGLAPFCTMALSDPRIERDLGLDGVTESVLYAAGVGCRPQGKWTPWPPARRRA